MDFISLWSLFRNGVIHRTAVHFQERCRLLNTGALDCMRPNWSPGHCWESAVVMNMRNLLYLWMLFLFQNKSSKLCNFKNSKIPHQIFAKRQKQNILKIHVPSSFNIVPIRQSIPFSLHQRRLRRIDFGWAEQCSGVKAEQVNVTDEKVVRPLSPFMRYDEARWGPPRRDASQRQWVAVMKVWWESAGGNPTWWRMSEAITHTAQEQNTEIATQKKCQLAFDWSRKWLVACQIYI